MITSHLRRAGLIALPLIGIYAVACSKSSNGGALMLAMTTDLEVPKDVGAVGVFVESNGQSVFSKVVEAVQVGDRAVVHLPATFAVRSPADGIATARMRVVAYKREGHVPLVLRQAISDVPTSRTALLRMPLEWINLLPNATTAGGSGATSMTSARGGLHLLASRCTSVDALGYPLGSCVDDGCKGDETLNNGVCADAHVKSADLPAFTTESAAFSSDDTGTGEMVQCFDTLACVGARNQPVVSPTDIPYADLPYDSLTFTADVDGGCTIGLPQELGSGMPEGLSYEPSSCEGFASGKKVNVSVRLPAGGLGACDGASCFVTLAGPITVVKEGSGALEVPVACDRLKHGLGLRLSYGCPTRPVGVSSCESTSTAARIGPELTGDQCQPSKHDFFDGGFPDSGLPNVMTTGEPQPLQIAIVGGRGFAMADGRKVVTWSATSMTDPFAGYGVHPRLMAMGTGAFAMAVDSSGSIIASASYPTGTSLKLTTAFDENTALTPTPTTNSQLGTLLVYKTATEQLAFVHYRNEPGASSQGYRSTPIPMGMVAGATYNDAMEMGFITSIATDGTRWFFTEGTKLSTGPVGGSPNDPMFTTPIFDFAGRDMGMHALTRGDDVRIAPRVATETKIVLTVRAANFDSRLYEYQEGAMGQPRFYGEYPIIDSPSRPRAKLAVDDRCIYMLKRVGGTAPATSMKIVCAARDGSGDYEVDMSHPGGGGVFTDPWAIAVDESVRWSPEAWLYYVDPTAGQIVATHRPMLAR